MNLKRRVISNPNKPKRLTEKESMKLKKNNFKAMLTSTDKPTLKIMNSLETTNFKKLINLPMPLLS
jgi:hypothetical protein